MLFFQSKLFHCGQVNLVITTNSRSVFINSNRKKYKLINACNVYHHITTLLLIRGCCRPLPWASVHWLVQCTLECHWLTQCTLGYHWATQRILARYTGTQLEKLSWNSPTLEYHWRNLVESAPHWDATGQTLNFAAYTGTPLEGLWQLTHAPTQS